MDQVENSSYNPFNRFNKTNEIFKSILLIQFELITNLKEFLLKV